MFEDKIPPQIDIISHDTSRTIKTLHKEERITIKGRVQDESEIVEVKVDTS